MTKESGAGRSPAAATAPGTNELVNAFPYDSAPRYVIRDRNKIYGADFVRRVRAMGSCGTSLPRGAPRGFVADRAVYRAAYTVLSPMFVFINSQDLDIWSTKSFCEKPIVLGDDGNIHLFRKWSNRARSAEAGLVAARCR